MFRWVLVLLAVIAGFVVAINVSSRADLSENGEVLLWTVAVGVPVVAVLWGLSWSAWRVFGPLGFVMTGRGCLAIAGIGGSLGELLGERVLYRTVFEPEPPDLRQEPPNPWTAVALIIDAERRGDTERAALLASGLDDLPPRALLTPRFRTFGIEHTALAAARRGDWREVARRVREGRGRGVRLLRLLARAHTGERPGSPLLWLACLLAPRRRESRAWLQAPAADRETGAPAASPWREHLRLLAGRPSLKDVLRLIESWEEPLGPHHEAEWTARGRAAAWEQIRNGVLGDLDLLLDIAAGAWPRGVGEAGALHAALVTRRRNRLLEELSCWTAAFPSSGEVTRPLRPPLEEWEDWLAFRRHLLRLAACGGQESLQTAWHNGVRWTACNWPFHLQKAAGARPHWAAYLMYVWSAWLAAWVGDAEIEALGQKNQRIAYEKAAERGEG